MTQEQFERWEDFAVRMAGHYPNVDEDQQKDILAEVKDYFKWRHYQEDWNTYEDWDSPTEAGCSSLSTDVDDFFEHLLPEQEEDEDYCEFLESDKYLDSLANKCACCIRAAFDIAVEQSGGVVGFTAGDLRNWYDGNVPDWMKDHWETPFDQIPDDDEIWL